MSGSFFSEMPMSSFGLYLISAIVLIGGLIHGARLLQAQPPWIVVGAVVLFGSGMPGAVSHTRRRDPPA